MNYPGFVGGSFESQAFPADNEDAINWYVEFTQSPGAASKAALLPTPGVTEIVSHITDQGRAHLSIGGREFAVIGSDFVEIDSVGTITDRGNVTLSGDPATISSNGDGGGQLFVTSGGNGYSYDLATNVLTQIAGLNGKATMGGAIDGYFLALDANTSTLYTSDLLDGLTWDPTQFAQRNSAPDPWVAMKVSGAYIWLMGEQTSEVWYNSGASPFPFARHPSGLVQYGIAAPFSAAVLDGTVIWLGASKAGNGFVLRASGFQPEVISSMPLQNAINGYGVITDAVGDSYNDRGHSFYMLTFNNAGVTHTWDVQTLLWHKRGTWSAENNKFVAWRPRWFAHAFGEHRALDSTTGAVYRVSITEPLDVDDRPIRRLRRAPALVDELGRIFYPGFELDLESGLGTATGQGEDPQVMMRYSNDGGKTWSTEVMRSAGKIGEYSRRVRWNRCGSGRRRVFEISVTDPIPWKIVNAYLTPDPQRAKGGSTREAA